MFVTRSRLKTQGAAVPALALLLGAGACTAPTATTDLRPDGPPEVLSVLIMNDSSDGFLEQATFCKLGDNKRPGLVGAGQEFIPIQVCDDDLTLGAGIRVPDPSDPSGQATIFMPGGVTDAVPTAWYARVMFDELLDPNIEELIPITEDDDMDPSTPEVPTGMFTGSLLNTQPFTLKCTAPGSNNAVEIAYDGYYSPSGNNVTWPLGPSLFVQPTDPSTVATGSTCTLSIKDNVLDKQGEAVLDDQRGNNGEYNWKIADLAFTGSAPAPEDAGMEDIQDPTAPLTLSFNAFIDAATLTASEVTITEGPVMADGSADCAGATTPKVPIITQADNQTIAIAVQGADNASCMGCAFNPSKTYVVTFSDTNDVADLAGGPGALPGAADFTLCFVSDVAP